MKTIRLYSPQRIFRASAWRAILSGLAALGTFVWLGIAPATLLGGTGDAPAPASASRPPAEQEKGKKAETGKSGPALLVEEKAGLRIVLDGQPVGSEQYQISPSGTSEAGVKEWTARGNTEVRLPGGGTMQVSAQFKLAADGTPLRYEWSAQSQKKASATIEFQGGAAKMTLQLEGAQPFVQELSFGSPRVVILDNNLYHHYAILARLYDWNGKGAQTFPVLIPQDMTPGSITVEALGPRDVSGASLELLRVRTADLEVDLYLDASRRLVRLDVPSSKAEILRE